MISSIYIIEIIIILILSIAFNFHYILKRLKKEYFLVVAMFIAFFVSALRGTSVGADTVSYKRYFEIIDKLSWKEALETVFVRKWYSTEIGYTILQKIVGIFFNHSQWIIAVCAGIYSYCMYYFIKKACKDKVMAMFVFLCTGSYLLSFNLMRQALGVGLSCVAWIMLKENRNKIAFLLLMLACSFHISSIVMFVVFIIENIPASRKMFGIIGIGMLLFISFGTVILNFVLKFFPVYQARYGIGRWDVGSINGILILWIIILALILLILWKTDWKVEKKHIDFEIIIYSLVFLMVNIVGQSYDGFARVSMFFQPFLIVLFDMAEQRFKGITKQIFVTGVIISCSLLFLKMASTAQYEYNFFFA